jgi:predicted DNA-binding transcriptional regulator AlpA
LPKGLDNENAMIKIDYGLTRFYGLIRPVVLQLRRTIMNWLTIKDLTRIFKMSKSTIYKWIQEDKFPKPSKVGPSFRSSRWLEKTIHEFINGLKA